MPYTVLSVQTYKLIKVTISCGQERDGAVRDDEATVQPEGGVPARLPGGVREPELHHRRKEVQRDHSGGLLQHSRTPVQCGGYE